MMHRTFILGTSVIALAVVTVNGLADGKKNSFIPISGKIQTATFPKGNSVNGLYNTGKTNIGKNKFSPGSKILTPGVAKNLTNKFSTFEKKKKTQTIQNYYKKNQGNLSGPEKNALEKLESGQSLSPADRQNLSGLLVRDGSMTAEEREAISQALNDDMERHLTPRLSRFLRLYNKTNEPVRVWVQYHTITDKNGWRWFPAQPDESSEAVVFDLNPGEARDLVHEAWKVHANRVRLWARSASGKAWTKYKSQDLVLVKEVDGDNQPRYFATETGTYTHGFVHHADPALANRNR